MPSTIAYCLRILCLATGLALAFAFAAEPAHPLLGLTREQVLQRLGEPRSQMSAGSRSLMLYARERVVLRDGVVVDVERILAEPVRRVSAPAAPAQAAADHSAPATPAPAATGAPAPAPAATEAVGGRIVADNAPAAAPEISSVGKTETAAAVAPEPRLEIKLVRPPSAGRSASSEPPNPPPAPPAAVAASPVPKEPATPRPVAAATAEKAVAPAAGKASSRVAPPPMPVREEPVVAATSVGEPPTPEEPASVEDDVAAKKAAEKKAKVISAARRLMEATLDSASPEPTPELFSSRTMLFMLLVLGGGIGYVVWRIRQRRLELDASAVSHTPFTTPAAVSEQGGTVFSLDLLAKLEWKRFEELVEAYYSKTGVVAARIKGGPTSPAQVKISWKGEPRPFAMVRCLHNPAGLIEAKPLNELYALLSSEDIRRGYVVTTGKFSVAARDLAEEKHLTLLPGDIFLEKLNALPNAARTEIMQAVTNGDYSVPSCFTCEAKMARSADDPPVWRCASHPDVTLPVRD